MTEYGAMRKAIVKGLSAYLGCPVIRSNQNAPLPDYPFISYTVTTVMSENKGTYSEYEDGTARKSFMQTWSISALAADNTESVELATKARTWFDFAGSVYLSDNDVVVVSVGSVTNRDNVISTEYEYKNGFDVFFSLDDIVKGYLEDTGWIESVTINEEEYHSPSGDTYEEIIAALREELEIAEKKLEAANHTVDELTSDLAAAGEQLEAAEKELEEANQSVEEANRAVEEANKTVNELTDSLATVEEELNTAKNTVDKLTGNLNDTVEAINDTGVTGATVDNTAEKVPEVYTAGYNTGSEDGYNNGYETGAKDGYTTGHNDGIVAGKEAERQTFWETYQRGGRRNQYRNAFYDACWTDENYNPKYPIVCSAVSNDAFSYCGITDTKVDIDFSHASSSYVFRNCASLKTIKKLIVTENVAFTNWFINDTALENIVIEGVIGKSIDFKQSPLTVESMKSIISCLKNYAGTANANVYEVSFSSACWDALEASGASPDGNTWKQYVFSLGWLT